ncbi:MAG: flagellar biosynthesis protein FlhA [Oscillospiraceae bacterium]
MKVFNNVVSAFVVGIIFLLLIPLPPFFLDLMFILNLTISFIILITTMYIKESLEFSIFPSLLLITTLFRVALNVSSTRLILLEEGNAGQVVKTFGEFVIRGNAVVGFVIFLIIVIVQFIVITKGSERVAEVSARFTLDAMPGKQMAIDADLSSGLVDEQTAKERRLKIQREADFFGSMDGASKFVKGDAITSIIITLINLIGGTIIGLMSGGGMDTVITTYTTATVGDGLISQLPALLISVATGMIVTRSASESNLNTDVTRQFLSQPVVLIMSGVVILGLVLIPGFPIFQIVVVSGFLIILGITLIKNQKDIETIEENDMEVTEEITSEANYYKNIENIYNLLNVEQIEMEFGYSLIPLVDEASGGSFIDRVIMFRKQFAVDMGIVVPSVRIKDSGQLNPNKYVIKLKGEEVASGDILLDHYLALPSSNIKEEIEGIDTIEPAFNIEAKWISSDKKVRAELAGYTLIDPTSVIITHLSEIIKKYAYELLTRQEVENLINNVKKTNETLVNDVIPNIITIGDFQKVMSNLLRESVPIRDISTILETLADYGSTVKDTDMLTEYVRQSLKRTISRKFSEANQIKVISLDSEIENLVMNSVKKMENSSYLALEPQVIQQIITATSTEIDKIKDIVSNVVIITSPIVRIYFKKLVDQFYPNVVVISFNEVDNNVQIQAMGNIVI